MLFNFFKRKQKAHTLNAEIAPEPYLCDLNLTNKIFQLCEIPLSDRDEKWRAELISALPLASFKCGDPQVSRGEDGFPYFQLHLPEANTEFQCYVIDKMLDDFLLESGFGVTIHSKHQVEWVLSYGDLVNYHLNKSFYSDNGFFSKQQNDETISETEEVMIGIPSESILHKKQRKVLKEYLTNNEVKEPKILLMARKKGNAITQDLVFNITNENFETEERYRNVMYYLSWYLPRHYSYVGIKEETFQDAFTPL